MGLITGIRQGIKGAGQAPGVGQQPLMQPAVVDVSIPHEAVNITYTAGFLNVVPSATGTDVFTIENPVAGTVIKVTHLGAGAIAGAAVHQFIQLLKRTTLNTGGTMTTAAAVPMDSSDPFVAPAVATANAVVRFYTVNPVLGTAQGSVVRADRLFVPSSATAAPGDPPLILGEFGFQAAKNVALRQNELLALNLTGSTTITSMSVWVWWTEEIDRGPVFSEG